MSETPDPPASAADDVEAPGLVRWSPRHGAIVGSFRGRAAPLGALAVGASALGALAIGALAIGRLSVGRARFKDLKIGRLEVDDLVLVRRNGRPF